MFQLKRTRIYSFGLVALLSAAACSDRPSPASSAADSPLRPGPAGANLSTGPQGRGPERLSERLARVVPQFGGAYVASDGTLVVYLTDSRADAAIRAALNDELRRIDRPAQSIRTVRGEYAFKDLDRWVGQVTPHLAGLDLVFTEVDERSNRIRIGIAHESGRAAMERALAQAGVPRAAALIEVAPRPQLFTSLRGRISPLTAGSQITFWTSTDARSECTYGPNVVWQGARHMLVNSHCTPPQGGPTVGTSIWQPKVPTWEYQRGKYQVGEEIQDPDWRTDVYGCAPGNVCRYSDAALIAFRYADRDWDLGGVMRTRSPATLPTIYGTLEIDVQNWSFEMTGIVSDLFTGDVINKVGRTTGWTIGTLESSCRNIFFGGRGYLCSGVVKAGGGKGDSGSPVFWTTSAGQHRLVGMLFGGLVNAGDDIAGDTYYFSNWRYIDYELGVSSYADLQAIETYPSQPGTASRYVEGADDADTPPPGEEPGTCEPTSTEIICPA